MAIKTVKMSSGHQVYLPDEILEEARVGEEQSFVVRVREGRIELIPVELAERAIEEGLENLQRASLEDLTEAWDNPKDEAWNDA